MVVPIRIEWLGPAQFLVVAGSVLTWEVTLSESRTSRAMNTAARLLPEGWWREPFVLSVMGATARFALGTGRVNLSGYTPNGTSSSPIRGSCGWSTAAARSFAEWTSVGWDHSWSKHTSAIS